MGIRERHAHVPVVATGVLAATVLAACSVSGGASPPDSSSSLTGATASTTLAGRSVVTLPDGQQVAYTSTGPDDGPTLLLLHGLTNDAHSWADVSAELARLMPGLRIIAVDLPGHGQSSKPTDIEQLTMPAMARTVVDFMDALGITKASIAGHSMGSLVAQDVALAHPERTDKLILVSTTANATTAPILGDWLLNDVIQGSWKTALEKLGVQWPDQAMSKTPVDADPNAVQWMQQFWNVYPLTPGRDTSAVANEAARLPLATWLGATEGIMAVDNRKALAALKAPTLVLWGTQDAFFLKPDQDVLIEALKQAAASGGSFAWKQYGRLPLPADGLQADDIGHNLTWDAPTQVAQDIASFLQTGRPTTTEWFADAPRSKQLRSSPTTATIVTQ